MSRVIDLIAIDLDGTLLNRSKEIPAANRTAIAKAIAHNIKIVLCTGRPLSGTRPYFDQLGLSENEYSILYNGCATYNSSDWTLRSCHALSFDELDYLYHLTADFPGISLTLATQKHYFVLADTVPPIVQADGDLVFLTVEPITLTQFKTLNEPVFNALYMGDPKAVTAFERALRPQLAKAFSVVRSQDYLLEVLPQGVTKASALKELANDLGVPKERLMAIGDAANDIEMLTYAGLGVAMGNATESIKQLADAITADCDQAGVAQAIYTYALNPHHKDED